MLRAQLGRLRGVVLTPTLADEAALVAGATRPAAATPRAPTAAAIVTPVAPMAVAVVVTTPASPSVAAPATAPPLAVPSSAPAAAAAAPAAVAPAMVVIALPAATATAPSAVATSRPRVLRLKAVSHCLVEEVDDSQTPEWAERVCLDDAGALLSTVELYRYESSSICFI